MWEIATLGNGLTYTYFVVCVAKLCLRVWVFFICLGRGLPLSGALSPHSCRAPLRCPSPTAPTARYRRATKAPSGLISV